MNRSTCVCDLLFSARTHKSSNAVSKHLGILPNIRRGGNNAKVYVKRASSAAIIVCLVGVSKSCDDL